MTRVIVIGAGVGGLTTAASLARSGLDVTVLEAHVYPGGCAGTFYHQGYRFDAGATLAGGFYPGGPMDIVARETGVVDWCAVPDEQVMQVHLPGRKHITRWSDDRRWQEYLSAFGETSQSFWRWQEQTADALWDLALRLPPWPAQSLRQAGQLAQRGLAWLGADLQRLNPTLIVDAFSPLARHLAGMPEALRLFVDGQLLIAAQTTSSHANALYGASALDLPRRGAVHLEDGMGRIAQELAGALRRHGGHLYNRQEVKRIVIEKGRPVAVETRRGDHFSADIVIANLSPWNVREILGDSSPLSLRRLSPCPDRGWGAFTVYAGLDEAALPDGHCLHHQILARQPMGEGNSAFLSVSPAWDVRRAPQGQRALTISTHTALPIWWDLFENDRPAYEMRQQEYAKRLLDAAQAAIPDLQAALQFVMPGSPVTFQRFTRRMSGWVGGYPQTSLFETRGPRILPGLWMVGDSIFPGQSTAAVALGGLRVAQDVMSDRMGYS